MAKVFYVLIFVVCCSSLSAFAFNVPDVSVIGKSPKIHSVSTMYLIPGDKVKVMGENFLSFPKSANKLFLNGKRVRVLSATNNELEFVVPRLMLGEAQLKLYVKYLGIKSEEVTYSRDDVNVLQIVFKPPTVFGVSSVSVEPMQKLLVFGDFSVNNDIYLMLDDTTYRGKVVSPKQIEVDMPKKLPLLPIKLQMFYRKAISRGDENIYFNSAPSKEFTVYNVQFGNPAYLNIHVEDDLFTNIPSHEVSYRVDLIFNNGQKVDVTGLAVVSVDRSDVIDVDEVNHKFRIQKRGIAHLKAEFLWEPSLNLLEDMHRVVVDLPVFPLLHEVIIDEVFPFASGFFPETDSNGDGFARESDEFIELKNLTDKPFDLTGCQIFKGEDSEPLIVFVDETVLNPFEYLVLYGDKAVEGDLSLSNSGSVLELVCNNQTIDFVAYPRGKNGDHSWQREANLDGFVEHPDKMFSPGKPPPVVASMAENEDVIDVMDVIEAMDVIDEGEAIDVVEEVNAQSNVVTGDLIINEILAAPDKDVNGDGEFNSSDDEFVELVNISDHTLDLSGLILLDKTKERHIVPNGTMLESMQALVVFGDGSIENLSNDSLFQIASGGSLGLNNTGMEEVTLQTMDGEIIDMVEFTSSGIKGASLNREVDLGFGDFISHSEISSENYSPGLRIDLSSFSVAPN